MDENIIECKQISKGYAKGRFIKCSSQFQLVLEVELI